MSLIKITSLKTALPKKAIAISILLLSLSAASRAEDSSALNITGFLSLVAGSVIDGSRHQRLNYNPDIECPCVVTDWSNNGVYEGSSWTTTPDSKAGIQFTYTPRDDLSFTGQVITRATEPKPDVTWAYLSYKFFDHWQIDLGRKRVPLYFYSDFQDIGVAYPWITPPAEMYGWEATNYNGVNVRYKNNWQGIDISTSLFTGKETVKDNPYFETFSSEKLDNTWDNLVGVDLELSKDWWTTRLVYIETDVSTDYNPGITKQDMSAYGIAFNGDFDDWFFLSEAGINVRDDPAYNFKAPAFSIGAGYRLAGQWTIFANYSQYRERTNVDTSIYEYFRYNSSTLVLRYDLTTSSDIKIQFDKHDDDCFDYTGDASLLRISYDLVF